MTEPAHIFFSLLHTLEIHVGVQGYGRVAPPSGGQQSFQSSGGIPPSFDVGSGGQSFGQSGGQSFGQPGGQSFGQPGGQSFGQQGGQSFGQQGGQSFGQPGGQSFGQTGVQSGGQSYGGQSGGQDFGGQSGGQGTGSKYNAGHALADQGVAEQAAFVGSKTVGHHNIPHYDKEDPKLPAAGAMSESGMAQQGGASGRGDNLPSQDQVTAATEGQPTGQVHCLASCLHIMLHAAKCLQI